MFTKPLDIESELEYSNIFREYQCSKSNSNPFNINFFMEPFQEEAVS